MAISCCLGFPTVVDENDTSKTILITATDNQLDSSNSSSSSAFSVIGEWTKRKSQTLLRLLRCHLEAQDRVFLLA